MFYKRKPARDKTGYNLHFYRVQEVRQKKKRDAAEEHSQYYKAFQMYNSQVEYNGSETSINRIEWFPTEGSDCSERMNTKKQSHRIDLCVHAWLICNMTVGSTSKMCHSRWISNELSWVFIFRFFFKRHHRGTALLVQDVKRPVCSQGHKDKLSN